MTQNAEKGLLGTGPSPEDSAAGGRRAATVAHTSDSAQQGLSFEGFRARRAFERDRRELALDIVQTHLSEQPSPRAIRSCSRRWAEDIRHIAEAVIKARQEADA